MTTESLLLTFSFMTYIEDYLDTEQCGRILSTKVEITLRLTVSQSERLGVEPTVGLVSRY
jgi:hypothetical protein